MAEKRLRSMKLVDAPHEAERDTWCRNPIWRMVLHSPMSCSEAAVALVLASQSSHGCPVLVHRLSMRSITKSKSSSEDKESVNYSPPPLHHCTRFVTEKQ